MLRLFSEYDRHAIQVCATPKGTPKEIIATLNTAVVEALADASVRQRYTDVGHEIAPLQQQTPEGLYAYHKSEIEKWWPIIKAANIKVQ